MKEFFSSENFPGRKDFAEKSWERKKRRSELLVENGRMEEPASVSIMATSIILWQLLVIGANVGVSIG